MDFSSTDYDPKQLFDLTGKTAFVTGASGGLGYRFAWTLAKAGARVIATARSTDKLLGLAKEISKFQGECVVETLDMRAREAIRECVEKCEQDKAIDVVINNAGIAIVKPPDRYEDEDWDAVYETNLRGPWTLAQAVIKKRLIDQR